MDAKDVKNRGLTVEEYSQIVKMLLASEEDFEVAMSNIDNLRDDSKEWDIIMKLLYKELTFSRRHTFNSKFSIIGSWYTSDVFTYRNLYEEIRNFPDAEINLKDIFHYVVRNEFNETLSGAYEFIDNVKINIVW